MSIVSEIQRINTNIANSYTAVDNKNGTLPQVQNSANLASAIDSIQSSNIIGATAEGESLSLTNTKAMPYSDYVVEGKSEQETGILPEGYTQVEYITSDGNSYIDTNLQINGDFEIDLDFIKNQSSSDEQPIISIWTLQYNYWNLYLKTNDILEWYVSGHNIAKNIALIRSKSVMSSHLHIIFSHQ